MPNTIYKVEANAKLEEKLAVPFIINHTFLKFSYVNNETDGNLTVTLKGNESALIQRKYTEKLPNLIFFDFKEMRNKELFLDKEYDEMIIESNVNIQFTIDYNYNVSDDVMDELIEKYNNKKAS